MTQFEYLFKYIKDFDVGTVFKFHNVKFVVFGFDYDPLMGVKMYYANYERYEKQEILYKCDILYLYLSDKKYYKKIGQIDKADINAWITKLRLMGYLKVSDRVIRLSDKEELQKILDNKEIDVLALFGCRVLPVILGFVATVLAQQVSSSTLTLFCYLLSLGAFFFSFVMTKLGLYKLKGGRWY